MSDACGVDVFEASQDLVEKEGYVFVSYILVAEDDLVEVPIHLFSNCISK